MKLLLCFLVTIYLNMKHSIIFGFMKLLLKQKAKLFSGRFIITKDIHILRNIIYNKSKQFVKI